MKITMEGHCAVVIEKIRGSFWQGNELKYCGEKPRYAIQGRGGLFYPLCQKHYKSKGYFSPITIELDEHESTSGL